MNKRTRYRLCGSIEAERFSNRQENWFVAGRVHDVAATTHITHGAAADVATVSRLLLEDGQNERWLNPNSVTGCSCQIDRLRERDRTPATQELKELRAELSDCLLL